MRNKSPKAADKEVSPRDRGILKPLAENGLPPGISSQRARDPGNVPEKKRPVKNRS